MKALDGFMAKYNDGKGLLALAGGDIALSETRLDEHGGNSKAGFVRDLSALGSADFDVVVSKMDEDSKRAYLHNKYGDFFSRNAGHMGLVSDKAPAAYKEAAKIMSARDYAVLGNKGVVLSSTRNIPRGHALFLAATPDTPPSLSKSSMTLETFMSMYNAGAFLVTAGGDIYPGETGIDSAKPNPKAPFVRDLSALSDETFAAVLARMNPYSTVGYLYNKYPNVFAGIDAGAPPGEFSFGAALNGSWDDYEIRKAGGTKAIVEKLRAKLEARDFDAMLGVSSTLVSDGNQIQFEAALSATP